MVFFWLLLLLRELLHNTGKKGQGKHGEGTEVTERNENHGKRERFETPRFETPTLNKCFFFLFASLVIAQHSL